jgi:hypothetical protein
MQLWLTLGLRIVALYSGQPWHLFSLCRSSSDDNRVAFFVSRKTLTDAAQMSLCLQRSTMLVNSLISVPLPNVVIKVILSQPLDDALGQLGNVVVYRFHQMPLKRSLVV